MGLFSGDKTYSTTQLSQESSDVNTGGDVSGLVQGKGASYQTQDLGGGLLIGGANTGEVVFNQFPEAVKDSVTNLVSAVKEAVTTSAQSQQQATNALGTKLQELSLGESSIIPKIAMYGLVAFGIAIIAKRLLK